MRRLCKRGFFPRLKILRTNRNFGYVNDAGRLQFGDGSILNPAGNLATYRAFITNLGLKSHDLALKRL